MATVKSFEVPLSDEDMLHFELEIRRPGVLAGFAVNYSARIGGEWRDVVRYDTSHGHLHVHRNWLHDDARVRSLEDPKRPKGDYARDLERAKADLVRHWRRYRRRMEDAA